MLNKYLLVLTFFFTNTVWANTSIQKQFINWGNKNNLVGAAMSIDGNTYYYGFSQKKNKIKVNSKTVFGIGSVTKTFVSVTLLLLEEKGKININDSITKYFPEYKRLNHIKIKDLMSMDAGLNDVKSGSELLTPEAQIQDAYENYNQMNFHHWKYSNVSYQLLGKLIEKVTGQSLSNVIRQKIIEPLDLKSTYFPSESQSKKLYEYQDNQQKKSNYSLAFAAGGMVSNVHDLHVFINKLFVKKTLLSLNQYHEMTSFIATPKNYYAFTGTEPPQFGLAVFKWKLGKNRSVLTYPGVMKNGFATTFIVFNKRVIILQSNTYNNMDFTLLWPYKKFVLSLI